MISLEFQKFPKIPRLSREIVITEKIDGTNACVAVFDWEDVARYSAFECPAIRVQLNPTARHPLGQDLAILCGSRERWLTRFDDNHGFGNWVYGHRTELALLDVGRHYGEWWGAGINRGYGMKNGERFFSLFNTSRWGDCGVELPPACCRVVPVLYRGDFDQTAIDTALATLKALGSAAAPRFNSPEGVIIYHTAANQMFKKTLTGDEKPKGSNG